MEVEEIPVHIARTKAMRVQQEHAGRLIIAADTVVVLDGRIIGKPADTPDAKEILMALSGRTHRVITGVVILLGDREETISEITEVTFNPLTAEQITFYIDKYQPFDKAGAYGIQEWIGVIGISGITGDFYNVMGLPVSRVVQALARMKR